MRAVWPPATTTHAMVPAMTAYISLHSPVRKLSRERVNPRLGADALHLDPVTGLPPQYDQKRAGRAPVAFAKRVNGIELGNMLRSLLAKLHGCQPIEITLRLDCGKALVEFRPDELRQTEQTVAFRDLDDSVANRPIIDILE
jgi:hypothetical protein